MGRWVIGVVAFAVAWTALPSAQAPAAGVDVTALIDTYYQGRHDAAVSTAAALPDLGSLRLRFVQDTPNWILADPANANRRRAAVAAFIVELAAARLESDWGRLSDLIEWTCARVLVAGGPPTAFERSWHMATTALAGRARERVWLLGPFARLPHQKPRAPQNDDPPSPKHLMHALERFPDDPRLQLARVNAWTWGRDEDPIRNLRRRESGERRSSSRPAQLEAVTAFEQLIALPAVAAEAQIRIGLIHVTAGDHAAALRAFQSAQPIATGVQLTYLSHFLAGRALEALKREDEAIAQYQWALEMVPAAESATVALASLQFLRNDREPAVAAVEKAFAAPAAATDPGRLIGYGAFLHWPEIKAAMRAELK